MLSRVLEVAHLSIPVLLLGECKKRKQILSEVVRAGPSNEVQEPCHKGPEWKIPLPLHGILSKCYGQWQESHGAGSYKRTHILGVHGNNRVEDNPKHCLRRLIKEEIQPALILRIFLYIIKSHARQITLLGNLCLSGTLKEKGRQVTLNPTCK